MNKIWTFLSLISLILVFGCDDEATCQSNEGIIGSWSMVNYFKAFTPELSFEKGEVIWNFMEDSIMLTVNTEIPMNTGIPFEYRMSGKLPYHVSFDIVTVDGLVCLYSISEDSSELVIDCFSSFDGQLITFESNCP